MGVLPFRYGVWHPTWSGTLAFDDGVGGTFMKSSASPPASNSSASFTTWSCLECLLGKFVDYDGTHNDFRFNKLRTTTFWKITLSLGVSFCDLLMPFVLAWVAEAFLFMVKGSSATIVLVLDFLASNSMDVGVIFGTLISLSVTFWSSLATLGSLGKATEASVSLV